MVAAYNQSFMVGDLILTKQFPNTPLLIRSIEFQGCDMIYVVKHAGCYCYLLESDFISLLSSSMSGSQKNF
jgi:hypothetical protein